MPSAAITNPDAEFSAMYDKYSPMLYGILVQLTDSKKQAEQIITEAFVKAHTENICIVSSHCIFSCLLKLTVGIAHKRSLERNRLIDRVAKLPMLHRLLLADIQGEDFNYKTLETPFDYRKKIVEELQLMRLKKIHINKTDS